MKKSIDIILFLVSFTLASCGCYSKGNEIFYEGNFVGDIYYDTDTFVENAATLNVKNISKQEYEEAQGIDVLKDINNNVSPYFSVELKIKTDEEYLDYHFYNLNGRKHDYCIYYDNNGNGISPMKKPNSNDMGNLYYSIAYKVLNDKNEKIYMNILFNLEDAFA